ncbi:hypothetical protein LVJ94_24715 [Pendulispora rubella]|uniref:Dickkopf N-terminal cysteine-rich domain-containing protein n=1 Tax=Pendulispora rubella TaxID=2741070 RepID=A0ABZ2LHJ5_9BACT
MWVRFVLGTAFAALGFLACSGGDDNTDKGPNGGDGGGDPNSEITAERACANYAQSRCAELNECQAYAFNTSYVDMNDCVTRFQAICNRSLTAPGTGKTPARVDECAKALKLDHCDNIKYNQPLEACKPAGTLEDGAPCGDAAQCKGRYCKRAEGSTCGVCATLGQSGAACDSDSECDNGFGCSNDRCTKICPKDATCESGQICGLQLVPDVATHKCVPKLGEGQACSKEKKCNGAAGLYCNQNTLVCTRLEYVGAGQACGLNEQTKVDTDCRTGACSDDAPHTCLADLPEGAKCDANGGAYCAVPAICANGVCKFIDATSCK